MENATIHLTMSNKIKAIKQPNGAPSVKYEIDASKTLETRVDASNASSTQMTFQFNDYQLNDYLNPDMRLRLNFEVSVTGQTTQPGTGVTNATGPYLINENNSGFESNLISKALTKFTLKVGSYSLTLDESQISPSILSILSNSWNKQKMKSYGENNEFNDLYDLTHFYPGSDIGMERMPGMTVPENILTKNSPLSSDNDFTNLNKLFRCKLLGTNYKSNVPTGSTVVPKLLTAQWSRKYNAFIPFDITGQVYYTSIDSVFPLPPALPIIYTITQTNYYQLDSYLIVPYLVNMFSKMPIEKPLFISKQQFSIELNVNPNYISNAFKTSNGNIISSSCTMITALSSVITSSSGSISLSKPSVLISTYSSNLVTEEDDKISYNFFMPKLLSGLQERNVSIKSNAGADFGSVYTDPSSLNFNMSYVYKPSRIEKYMIVFADPKAYLWNQSNVYSTTEFGILHNSSSSNIGCYNFAKFVNFDIILNNINLLNLIFPSDDKNAKMEYLANMTAKCLADPQLYDKILYSDRRLALANPTSAGGLTDTIGNYTSAKVGQSFFILDMQKILLLYPDSVYTCLTNYVTNEIALKFDFTFQPNVVNGNNTYLYEDLKGKSNVVANTNYSLGTYSLQIYELQLHTFVQDVKTGRINTQLVSAKAEDFETAYDELRNKREALQSNEMIGGGWFDDYVINPFKDFWAWQKENELGSHIKDAFKGALSLARRAEKMSKNADSDFGKTIHDYTGKFSQFGKLTGNGQQQHQLGGRIRYI